MKKSLFVFGVVASLSLFLGLAGTVTAGAQTDLKPGSHKGAGSGTWTEPVEGIGVNPVFHASLELGWKGKILLFDPSFKPDYYPGVKKPDIVLITDIHGDHLDTAVLSHFARSGIQIVVPQAVFDLLPAKLKNQAKVLENGQKMIWKGIEILAMPMYNMADAKQMYHPRGRGNGYVLTMGGKKVYISGDTEDTPEMRHLKNIDLAFVCMNLPYTMDIRKAAGGVLAFEPAVVIPYHYRGEGGLSDIQKFKQLVEAADKKIRVDLLNFYPTLP